jgi:hypothetical protein
MTKGLQHPFLHIFVNDDVKSYIHLSMLNDYDNGF